ncbi:prolyl endopeptidase-like [Ctenocephalides felis]|uniref:prolyl endopeptidase-like n=1 Tax=Ctenocephalides felis TaxID=7515 RepID=UPI000E6E1BCE|nr:prolyl endopeptidase-like [Ctenocephalides felis]
MGGFQYPEARRDESIQDNFHGKTVSDPYRWLENPDSNETKDFVDAQNSITRPYIDDYKYRQFIKEKLTNLWNYPKYSVPYKRGTRYFFYKNTGLQNQSVLYKQESLTDEPVVFIDPNILSDDGTTSFARTSFSEDGSKFAYGLSKSGSDWFTAHFKDVETNHDYPDVLERIKFSSLTWTFDNKGIFYSGYPQEFKESTGSETNILGHQQLFYHVLGTNQSEDVVVVEFPEEPLWRISTEISDCGRYLFIYIYKETRDNLVYFCDLKQYDNITGKLNIISVVKVFEADYHFITNEGSRCIFKTNKDSPNYRLIQIDLEHPEEKNWITLLPEHPADVLDWATCANEDKLVLCYMQDVKNILLLWSIPEKKILSKFPLDVGTVINCSAKKNQSEIFYQFASNVTPPIIYRCDLTEPEIIPTIFRETKLQGFDSSKYKMEQVFYTSKDGTKIPMFICSKKSSPRCGSTPCLLYGYGGFNVSLTPTFSVSRAIFMHCFNGIIAVPNLRGGGEYGEKWHNAGRLHNKQNVFDDFCAAAEYLVQNEYTSANKLTIQGGSNGGLLVGACINQRPELFGAAIAEVGVMDMLRYHKFTIGYAWSSDYGTSDEEKHFHNLLSYSPLHNIKTPTDVNKQYPATLVLTADHDDRVVPLHTLKYIATLQHAVRDSPIQQKPLMALISTRAGHGGGKPTTKVIEEITDIYSFIAKSLGLTYHGETL